MDSNRGIETVRRFYDAGPSDVDDERRPFFAPDAVWHVPGVNHVSGAYRGVREITETMVTRMAPLDRWQIDVRDVMANGDLVVATIGLNATRAGVSLTTTGAHVFRLDADWLVAEAWGFVADQAGLDRLLDS
jgi:ketosteroid isomerase-like protein